VSGVLTAVAVAWLATAGATGTVAGRVLAEKVPAARPAVKIAKDAPVCGREAAAEVLVVAPDRAVANVVVAIKGIKPAQPPGPTPNAAVDQVGCRYTPHVQAITVGTSLALLNSDAVLHNVHGTLPGGGGGEITVFNVAMPFKGQKLPTVVRRPGVLKLRCDAGHSWMSAYVHVLDHPFFAVTDAQGRFTIKDVPAGKYTIEYWHEPVADKAPPLVKTTTVEVAAGKQTAADIVLAL
jgi:hypothetical protein